MKPLISICIPTFNGEKYLSQCLNSILAQEFGDIEILIVDDHSTDRTIDIIQNYAGQDRRIRLEKNPVNLGLVQNWNRCLELAQGEWIKFVFQDDLLEPNCLNTLLSSSQPNSTIIYCRRNLIFESGVSKEIKEEYLKLLSVVNQVFSGLTYISSSKYCEAVLDFIYNPCFNLIGEPTSVMFHRNVISRFGMFNPHIIQICDEEFWTRIAVNTGLIYVEENLANFRIHKHSTSAKNQQQRYYQLSMIDPLLRLHNMVFDPIYKPLREFANNKSPSIDLMQLLKIRAYKARLKPILFSNQNMIKEWNKAVELYPNLLSISSNRVLLEEFSKSPIQTLLTFKNGRG